MVSKMFKKLFKSVFCYRLIKKEEYNYFKTIEDQYNYEVSMLRKTLRSLIEENDRQKLLSPSIKENSKEEYYEALDRVNK